MKVYIQAGRDGLPRNYNMYNAYQGFREMGLETVFFHTPEELQTSELQDIVVGYVAPVRSRLQDFGIPTPDMDYPKELRRYMGRRIWHSKINTVASHPEDWPVFVKPVEDKKFTGIVVRSPADLIGCGSCYDNADVICSEVINIETEWRVFVRYGKILDVRSYRGDWKKTYYPSVIESAVQDFASAPAGYAVDFGVTDTGETVLIEVNDGYSLACYGLFYIDYAKLLSARWAELTGTEDACGF